MNSHSFQVMRCEIMGEAASTLAHARELADYAERMGSHQARIYGFYGLGTANILNCAWHEALEVLEQAMAIGTERRLRMYESMVLASMAAAHLGLGDHEKALTLAEGAIAVSRELGSRMWEFSALLVRIRTLRGLQAKETAPALAEAFAWLEVTGAKSYEPFLHVARAELARLAGDELREAHRLFTEIGAPIRAAEVAKEIAG